MADGLQPTLAELVALRGIAQGRGVPRRARAGQRMQAPSPMRGRGMEYAESREYTRGDDARHIDWRVTARTGQAHTKVFQAERERLTLLVADTAPSLYFGTRVRFKSVQAARAGALAAWAAMRDGDRLAALRGSAREAPLPPAGGQRGALRVLDALCRWYAAPPADDEGLVVALEHARRLLRPGSRVVVLADPASAAQVPSHRWAGLRAHNDVVLLLFTDPLEVAPPALRLPFLTGQRRVSLDLAATAQRQHWQQAFADVVADARERATACGVRVAMIASDAGQPNWLGLLGGARGAT